MQYPYWFIKAVDFTLEREKGYVNDPKDSGGETNWGISKRSYPQVDIKHLTREGAKMIYYNDFWNPLYEQIPNKVVMIRLFDTGVNMGVEVAVSVLQTTLRHFYDLPQVVIDGQFGQVTLRALEVTLASDPKFYETYRDVLNSFYVILTLLNHKKTRYLHGWENRLNEQIRI
ncbi:MAG: glycoside hydrolase family 108 protein [Syntrophomonadaceae bacterium]